MEILTILLELYRISLFYVVCSICSIFTAEKSGELNVICEFLCTNNVPRAWRFILNAYLLEKQIVESLFKGYKFACNVPSFSLHNGNCRKYKKIQIKNHDMILAEMENIFMLVCNS